MSFKRVRAIVILLGVWTLIGLTFASLSFFGTLAISDYRGIDLVGIFVWNLTAFYLWALLAPLIAFIARRHRLDRQHWPRSLFLVHLPASLVFPALHLCLYLLLYWLAGGVLTREFPTLFALFNYQLFANLPLKVSIYWLILIAINALDYYHSFLVAEVKASELRTQLAQAQLRALKMQLHPHFLFNTLNSISALLHRDPEAADQMVARLGDFLRLTLENSGAQEVTLEQEMAFLRCYLEIEIVRHDRLSVETDIEPETLAALVPNLILQPLVENAIRHGISRQSAPGRLSIRAARRHGRLRLEVEDNGPGLALVGEADAPGDAPADLLARTLAGGVGLANTRARLEHLYGADGRLDLALATPRGMIATLEIPFQVEAPAAAAAVAAGEEGAFENYKPEPARIDRAAG